MVDAHDLELTDGEQAALHELQLGIEHLYGGYGSVLEFHHTIGRGMDHLDEAETTRREAGHEELADRLRDEQLPSGVFEDTWSYEVVETFKRDFLTDMDAFEAQIEPNSRTARNTSRNADSNEPGTNGSRIEPTSEIADRSASYRFRGSSP